MVEVVEVGDQPTGAELEVTTGTTLRSERIASLVLMFIYPPPIRCANSTISAVAEGDSVNASACKQTLY